MFERQTKKIGQIRDDYNESFALFLANEKALFKEFEREISRLEGELQRTNQQLENVFEQLDEECKRSEKWKRDCENANAIYNAEMEKRRKEISVKKVLNAIMPRLSEIYNACMDLSAENVENSKKRIMSTFEGLLFCTLYGEGVVVKCHERGKRLGDDEKGFRIDRAIKVGDREKNGCVEKCTTLGYRISGEDFDSFDEHINVWKFDESLEKKEKSEDLENEKAEELCEEAETTETQAVAEDANEQCEEQNSNDEMPKQSVDEPDEAPREKKENFQQGYGKASKKSCKKGNKNKSKKNH